MQLFWNIIVILASPFIALFAVIYSMITINYLYLLIVKGMIPKKRIRLKKRHWFIKIFWDFPKQFALDLITKDPDKFRKHGTVLFCGRQGSGKTIALVYYLQQLKKEYPKLMEFANFHIDDVTQFYGWRSMVDNNNGEYGIVFAIDELSVWFNNKDSFKFPPEFLQDLNQQRKQRKHTVGTAQVFGQLAKDIRALPEIVYLPRTLFGCFTIVFVTRPEYWNNEKMRFAKYEISKTWFFIQNAELRNSYDTYERVKRSAREGFEKNVFISDGIRQNPEE